jgi:hypothetical protein
MKQKNRDYVFVWKLTCKKNLESNNEKRNTKSREKMRDEKIIDKEKKVISTRRLYVMNMFQVLGHWHVGDGKTHQK